MNLTQGRLSAVPTITLHTESFHEVRLPTTEELLYLVALELKAQRDGPYSGAATEANKIWGLFQS